MSNYAQTEHGVAPHWEAVDVSGGNQTPTGTCIGFYVSVAGDVAFQSKGTTLTVAFADNQFVTAQVEAFIQTGFTATGVYSIYI